MKNDKCDRRFDCDDYKYDHCEGCGGNKPQGDLISREALKKHITEIFETEEKIDKKWAMGLKYSLKIIDKAPAVEITETEIQEVLNKRSMTAVTNEYLIALHGRRPKGDCNNCDFRKFTEKFVDGVVEVMNEYDITSLEQLSEILKGGEEE